MLHPAIIMSNETTPLAKPPQNVVLDTASLPEPASSSVWDRVSKWVSENKALVYTIAGVAVVVTSAGVVYYLSDSSSSAKSSATAAEKRKSKNQRRKEKKKVEDEKKTKSASDGMSSRTEQNSWTFNAPGRKS